ncbi:unnamed protein product [Candidula unifasciata]|uniref:Centrosomal protein of 57 kDa-like n=1 Tax=Candidula unifasciata TaxID=100452 RepID=A0A8S3ZZJ4_9EUPU|nr:unnamed protein product [Candidula unifasciata]
MEENPGGSAEINSPLVFARPDSGISSYLDYPASTPFINTDYTRAADEPVDAFPTSNRDAVISALKNLHEKVKKLELERNVAEQNLHSLASETEQYKVLLNVGKYTERSCNNEQEQASDGEHVFTKQTKELEGQISSAERRCQRLEKQLEQMRKMVNNSEQNQRNLLEQMRKLQKKDLTDTDIRFHKERLNELERDQQRLVLTQTLAESKIKVLEQMLQEERLHRETLQQRTDQLESAAHDKHTLSPPSSPQTTDPEPPVTQVWKMRKSAKKKKKSSKHLPGTSRSDPMRHYRLNLAEIPFVAGQSTGPSHSLGANVQNVLAMLKLHNPVLCSQVGADGHFQRSDRTYPGGSYDGEIKHVLHDLLNQLQDEFGRLSSQHQAVLSQMHAARDVRVRQTLEQELDMLSSNMEMKIQQITRIRQYQSKMRATSQAQQTTVRGPRSRPLHTAADIPRQHDTGFSNKNSNSKSHICSSKTKDSNTPANPALSVLKDVKKIQRTLRKEDLYWE